MITDSFEIFIPDKKFYLTNNRVIYGFLVLGFLPGLFEVFILKKEEASAFSEVLFISGILSFVIGPILGFFSLVKYRPLRGVLQGKIVFKNDRITVHEEEYILSDIKKISFLKHSDYVGRDDGYSRGNFNWKLSQGVDNAIALHYEGGKIRTFHFLLIYKYHLRDIQDQLIAYHKAGKLHFLNLIDVLGISDYDEIQKFKNTL